MKKRQIVLLLILNLIVELILKSSNITNLVLIDLLVLTITVLLQKDSSIIVFIVFILFSMVIEFFSLKPIGVIGLSWFLGLLSIKIIGNFIHIFNLNRKNILSIILVYLLFVLFRLIINKILNESISIDLVVILLNLIILAIYNWILNKFYSSKYAFE